MKIDRDDDDGMKQRGPAMVDDEKREENVDGPTMKEVVARASKPLYLGTAVMPRLLYKPASDEIDSEDDQESGGQPADPSLRTRYARLVKQEFNAVVVEHHLKWAPLCTAEPGPLPQGVPSPRLGRYDFYHADAVVDWALQHGLAVKGHVLVWSVTSPVEILEEMEPHQIREHLKRHIFTTMGHFRGRIKVWDVVNEALAPDGTLAENVFLRKLGPSYIEEAFHWAHEADPTANLIYNDNKVEGMGGPNAHKSEAFFQLLKDLRERDVPVHGCGMQAHFNAAGVGWNRCPTPHQVKKQIRRLGQLGLDVNISEMDVRVKRLPANLRQIAQRQIYHDIIAAALSEPAFDGVWLWGFTDRHTWVKQFYEDDEPLILDEDYDRKEAYYALRDALKTLEPGGVVGGQNVILDSDCDADGKPWGHLWMQPEPEEYQREQQHLKAGDNRPDWQQQNS